jgi:hypothetical protein
MNQHVDLKNNKQCSIMLVAIKVHVISRGFVVLTWMHDKRGLVWHVTLWNTQSQHCNSDNIYIDDNVMRASVWFEFFGGLF